jgi:hypothetical protein
VVGGAETQVFYLFVPDARAHCARAKAAGAEIVFDVEDRANGGRSYSCRDLEGHLWNFGTYNPWAPRAIGRNPPRGRGRLRSRKGVQLAAGMLAGLTAIVTVAGDLSDPPPSGVAAIATGSLGEGDAPETLPTGGPSREGAGHEAGSLPLPQLAMPPLAEQQLASVRREIDELRKLSGEAEKQHLEAARERDAADQLVRELRERLDKAGRDKATAEQATKEARRQLARLRAMRRLVPDLAKRAQPVDPPAFW